MVSKPIPSIMSSINNLVIAESLDQVKNKLFSKYKVFFDEEDKDNFYPIFIISSKTSVLDFNFIPLNSRRISVLIKKFREKCEDFHKSSLDFMRKQIDKDKPIRIRPVLVISALLTKDDDGFIDSLRLEKLGNEGIIYWEKKEKEKEFFSLPYNLIKIFRKIMKEDFKPFVVLLSSIFTVDFASYSYLKGINYVLKAPKAEEITSFSNELITALRISHFDISNPSFRFNH